MISTSTPPSHRGSGRHPSRTGGPGRFQYRGSIARRITQRQRSPPTRDHIYPVQVPARLHGIRGPLTGLLGDRRAAGVATPVFRTWRRGEPPPGRRTARTDAMRLPTLVKRREVPRSSSKTRFVAECLPAQALTPGTRNRAGWPGRSQSCEDERRRPGLEHVGGIRRPGTRSA